MGIEILFPVGGLHSFFIELGKRIKVKIEYPHAPYFFNPYFQLQKRIYFSLDYEPELVARIFPYEATYLSLKKQYLKKRLKQPSRTANEKSIEISDGLTYENIESLSVHLSKQFRGKDIRRKVPVKAVVNWLKNEGFWI